MKVLFTFGIAILLVAGLYIFTDWFSLLTGYFTGESEQGRVAKCLADNGAEFYGTPYCADCEKQKEVFGTFFEKIYFVDCGREKENCPNIREVPAWYINGKIHYGLKTLTELKDISGCV